ncbi:hypothetical protein SCYAM73S_01853 [Streptomyces cyaneofuscatus]
MRTPSCWAPGSPCRPAPSTWSPARSARAASTGPCAARSWPGCPGSRSWSPPHPGTPRPSRAGRTTGTGTVRTGAPPPPPSAPSRPRSSKASGPRPSRVLAEVLPCLLPAGLERRPELRTLGVARVPLTEAIDRLAGLERDPAWWHRLYDSLAGIDPDRLTGLPVPLAGDPEDEQAGRPPRTTIGPRQVLLPLPDTLHRPCSRPPLPARPQGRPPGRRPPAPGEARRPARHAPRRADDPQVRAAVAGSLNAGRWTRTHSTATSWRRRSSPSYATPNSPPASGPSLGALTLPDGETLPPPVKLTLPRQPIGADHAEGGAGSHRRGTGRALG